MLFLSITCLAGAWALIFLRSFVGATWAQQVPSALAFVLLALAVIGAAIARRGARNPAGLWLSIALTAWSLLVFTLPSGSAARMQENWRRESAEQIAGTLADVGNHIARLEDFSASLGDRVAAHVRSLDVSVSSDPTVSFALLDSLSRSATRGTALAAGTAIGLQLFDPDGNRVAWSGWPQQTGLVDAMFIRSGSELVYTRNVSLYQILTHVIPVRSAGGERLMATLLVDMPLEVDYRVNNRFLKSTSLADQIPRGGVARVTFDYYPATGNLPERLERFQKQQAEFLERRAQMIAATEQNPEPARTTAPDDTTAQPPAPLRADSVMSYHSFPRNVEPAGEIVGDALAGLQGRVLVRSRVGNPILGAVAVGYPFSHYEAQRASRRAAWGKGLALAALFAFFFQAMRWMPRTGRVRDVVVRAGLYAAFMVALRFAILAFGTRSGWMHTRLFDPSVFATPTLGGLMRSVFDLALTALFLVILVYGLVRIVRARESAPSKVAPTTRMRALEVIAIAGTLFGAGALIRRFIHVVVVNANPRLLGETMEITDASLIVLHVGVFLMVTGILLAGMFVIWGVMRAAAETRRMAVCAAALVLVAVASLVLQRWDPLGVATLVTLFVVFAPRVVHREDLVSVGIVAFCLVVVSSGAAYTYLARDYDELRKGFVSEKAAELVNPSDNWKVVILEDVLGEYAQRHEIRQALRSPQVMDVDRLAFDLWADGPLSLLGYSCSIHVLTAADSVVSEFAVDMPYRARISEGGERTDTPDQNRWAVMDLTRSTPQGIVRFYRGILNVDESDVYEAGDLARRVIGKVIVDVPFFFGSLELAARTGPRTPEVLRNVQEGGVAPRVEEPEALLLARVDKERRITESSSERLAVGTRVPRDVLERAREKEWPLLRASTGTYRVMASDLGDSSAGGQTLLAGFRVPSPARYLLRWSTLFSLYLFFTLVMLLAVVALATVPSLGRVLPTLTPGGRLGFQQKLLASFLLVALTPAVILGLFSVDFIKGRFTEESRDEASVKVQSARGAVANILHGEMQFHLANLDVPAFFKASAPRIHPLGERRIAALFADASVPDGRNVSTMGTVDGISGEELALITVGSQPYVGVFSAPIDVSRADVYGRYHIFYGRAVDEDLLGEIAEQVGADVNVYVDGNLVASSREGLLAGGFISATMNEEAFVEVSLLGSERALATERAGSYDFQVAYLPVTHWQPVPGDTAVVTRAPTRAALAVPLLFRPESYSLEVQRATSVALGVFALLLAATIALGLLVARGVFEPMRELVAGTRRISQGDFNVRLREDRADEVGIVATAFNEMTERIAESQRALEERRRYLEAILENIGAGVISTDAEGRVRTVNSAAERIAGVPARDAEGRTAGEIAREGHAERLFAQLDPAAAESSPFETGELEIERGGRRATIKYMRTRLESGDRYAGTVFVFEDLTELIESKKLSAWVEMARQIAHEIKNPLTPIRISTQFMRRAYEQRTDQFDRIFREGTETIIHQVDVLKRIAGEFSSFGRLQKLDMKPHAVDPLVRGIVAPYVNNSSNVDVVYENGAADARIVADEEAVRKICANLIENALEAMGSDGGELHVRCRETTVDGSRAVRIVFRDNGPGLDEEAAKRLFEPYFSTKTTGTGLGLAICRTLSREMGGDVTIENLEDERGVEAVLTLRRAG